MRDVSVPVQSLFRPGSFVIVDASTCCNTSSFHVATDADANIEGNPLVTQNEANSVFHVMLQMFVYGIISTVCT